MRSERASKPHAPLAWRAQCGLVAVGLALTHACIVPEATCEYTKTCVETSDDASVESSKTSPDDARAANIFEGGMPDSTTVETTFADASVDASVQPDADAHVSEPQTCERLIECPEELPVCHETERVCTQCDNDFDCNATPATRFCKLMPGHEQDNECVQCLNSSDCDAGVCVNNQCVSCNTKTDDGCTQNLPHCVLVDDSPTCVLCDTNEDCSAELPVCADHQCVLCTSEDNTHCPTEAPICVTDETPARCVGCRHDNDCQNLVVGDSLVNGLCIDEQCTVCELGSNRNCTGSQPYCVALLPQDDGGVAFFSPSPSADSGVPSEQYLSSAHQCVECLNADACEGGSLPGCFNGSCVECTATAHCTKAAASICDTNTHLCVGCSDVGDCVHLSATSACDVENHVCVECTAERDTCGNKVCQTVPGADQFTCSDEQAHSVGICDECLSDTHCPNNSACVLEVYDGAETGYRCLPIQGLWNSGSAECANNSPFVGSIVATSVDGLSATFCKPRTTSCQGYADFGSGALSNEAGEGTCNSNEDCGLSGVADGVCVPWSETTNFCTYPCIGDVDCSTECSNTTAVDDSAQQVCSLNP